MEERRKKERNIILFVWSLVGVLPVCGVGSLPERRVGYMALKTEKHPRN